jgi:AcrR family transcriptional regulator
MPSRPDRSPPAQRLLDTAADLFAREGIRAVGIERVLADADVARASLYQSFGSKDGLVVAYLDRQDALDRRAYERATARLTDPVARILTVFDLAEKAARRRRYRGCLYLNAATEFPDPRHPVIRVVQHHRQWLLDQVTGALGEVGAPDPEATAHRIQLLYDGALAGSKGARSCEPIRLARQMAEEHIRAATDARPAAQTGLRN